MGRESIPGKVMCKNQEARESMSQSGTENIVPNCTKRVEGIKMTDNGKEKIRTQITNLSLHHLKKFGNYSESLSCGMK